ncbi:MAG: hypothetical protein HeimC3_55140, partial [Candidatus Heimdallarchaeota archaeon LC_3]
GLVDADGSIFNYQYNQYTLWKVDLTGNKSIVTGFTKYVKKSKIKTRAKPVKNKRRDDSYMIGFNGLLLPQKVATLLYYDSNIHLDRKKVKVGQLLQQKHTRNELN